MPFAAFRTRFAHFSVVFNSILQPLNGSLRFSVQCCIPFPKPQSATKIRIFASTQLRQGHHHNGDQAARRQRMMCSICGRQFANPRFGVRGSRGRAYSVARPYVTISSPLTHIIIYLLPLLRYLAVYKSVSARQSVRPGYDDKCRSRSYCFVERRKSFTGGWICV